MPPPPDVTPRGPGRRELLAAGLVVLAGAGGGAALATAGPPQPESGHPAPPSELLDAYAAEQALIAAIDAAARADPALARDVAAVRADHVAHAGALAEILDGYRGQPRPPAPGPARAVPRAELAAAEQNASALAARRAAALAGPVATLVASIAASEACHAQVLS